MAFIRSVTENFGSRSQILVYLFHLSGRCHLSSLFGPWVSTWHQAGWISTVRLPLSLTWWERWATVQENVPKFWRRGQKEKLSVSWFVTQSLFEMFPSVKWNPSGTWMLSAFAASSSSYLLLVPVLAHPLLTCSLLDPVCPGAASPTPGLPGAHPWQRGPPHFIVTMCCLVGETQRHARVWGHSRAEHPDRLAER